MDDEEAFKSLLSQHAEGYALLYPSILPRLRQAYEGGNPMVKQAVLAMAAALARAQARREGRLRNDHGLTPTEVKVVLHLVDGGTVSSCAAALAVAESTVRSHLKSVFAKTGVQRQAQLAALLKGKG
jgi:DNA-binding CsgD family transcriptional regulator